MYEANYLNPRSTQTLRQAIDELRAREGTDDAAAEMAPELAVDIEVHDVVHVLFGCSTDLRDEVIAHIWTAIGTTYGSGNMVRVNIHRDHREVLRKIGVFRLVCTWVTQFARIISTIYRAHLMTKRFPANEYKQFLDKRLIDIRSEFGIELPNPGLKFDRTSGAALRTVRAQRTSVS